MYDGEEIELQAEEQGSMEGEKAEFIRKKSIKKHEHALASKARAESALP